MRCVTVSLRWLGWPTMSEPRRLHPVGIVLRALRQLRELAIPALLPVLVTLLREGFDPANLHRASWVLVLPAGVLVFAVLYGILAWYRHTYWVMGDELRVEQGILSRRQRIIPIERIQAVDISHGVLQRLLGVVKVEIQTAGGTSPEVVLTAVSARAAEELRLALRRHVAMAAVGTTESSSAVRRLSTQDLLLAGATSGRAGVALSLIGSIMSQFDEAIPWEKVPLLPDRLGGTGIVLAIAVFVVALAWLLSVSGMVLAHAGFSLRRDGETLLIERGLLERRVASLPIDRIQAVRIVEGLFRQPFGLVELRVESAAYGLRAGESTVLFPLLRRREVLPFLRAFLPEYAVEANLSPLPARARRRYALRLDLMWLALAGAILLLWLTFPAGILGLSLPVAAVLLGLWQYRDAGWAVVGESLVLCWRTLSRATAIVPRRRVQMAEVISSPFQRRARLATFAVRVTSGASGRAFALRHLDAHDAAALLTWITAHSRQVAATRTAGPADDTRVSEC